MTRAEIVAEIAAVARLHVGWQGELDGSERLVEELGLDSLHLLILAAEIENRFQIALAPEDEAAVRTVGELAAAIEERLRA